MWPNLLVLSVFLSLSATLSSGHTDSKGYETYTDKYGAVINSFKVHKTELVWNAAKAKCIEENAHLIIPNSESEIRVLDGFAEKIFQGKPKGELHVGFERDSKDMKEGVWRTVLGGKMEDATIKPWLELWRSGEPNNAGELEFCVSMDMAHSKYLDVMCNDARNARAFVCEKEIVDQEAPDVDARIRI